MKSSGTRVTILCAVAAAGLAVCLTFERRARVKLDRENENLRRQLSQMESVVAENQRLSNLFAQVNASASRPHEREEGPTAPDQQAKELVRLRGEVETLRQQNREIETLLANTRQLRAARENGLNPQDAGRAANSYNGAAANGPQLEILRAEYWTEKTNMDVAAELRDRIRGDSLKAIASNNLKGDPDFGQVKRLTVVYRFGGVTATNEFREGDYVVLPQE